MGTGQQANIQYTFLHKSKNENEMPKSQTIIVFGIVKPLRIQLSIANLPNIGKTQIMFVVVK